MSVRAATQTESTARVQSLLAAENDDARRQVVARHPFADWEEVVSLLADRARQAIQIDVTEARHIADIAITAAEAIGSKVALGRSQRAKANTLYAMNQHADAIELHRVAASLFEAAGEANELARTLSGSIQPLLLLGRYDEALHAGERARAIFMGLGNDWRLARLEINIGNIYQRQDKFDQAFQHYQRAYDGLVSRDDAEGLAAVLSNLSLCCIFLNNFPQALEFHQKARKHCQQKGMPVLVAYADYNIAYLYFLRGEYGRAIQTLREAKSSAKKAGDAYQLALCDLDLAEIYLEINLSTEAVGLAHQAHAAFLQLGFGYEAAKALAFAAIASSRQGRALEALNLFARAKDTFARDQNQVWVSLVDLYRALVLLNEGRLFEARQLATEAHKCFEASGLRRKAVLTKLLMARILLHTDESAEARQLCRNALTELRDMESPILIYDAEFLLGEIERSSDDQEEAYQAYSRARVALETLRGSLRGEELKIAFFDNRLEVYEQLVDLCLQRSNGVEEAFAYMEQAKSRSLVELLSQPVHTVSKTEEGQSELVRSIRNLREELNLYYNLIEREQLRPEENSAARIDSLEQQARTRETALLRTMQEATDLEIDQAGLQRRPSSVSVEEVRAILPDETTLVEYFCVRDRVLACVLGRNGLRIVPVTLQSRVQKQLYLLQFQISKFHLDPAYVNRFQERLFISTLSHLQALYQELIAPLNKLLAGSHLVFVPHGLLHYIPMHALHDGEEYLIDRFTVSYAPSASIYAMCRKRNADTSGGSLILGIADAQAPSILDEVAALKNILPGSQLFTGENATRAILEEHGLRSRIVHIATHGYFRQDNPMFSSIRLGDSYLSLYDLYQLKLPAELVVLSGCATGVNVVRPGDEQIGLVRGLLHAGAQSVVLSLWDVHDTSTKDFMLLFYKGLQSGLDKRSALRKAMLELRAACPHPYYWAPFLLIGKG